MSLGLEILVTFGLQSGEFNVILSYYLACINL